MKGLGATKESRGSVPGLTGKLPHPPGQRPLCDFTPALRTPVRRRGLGRALCWAPPCRWRGCEPRSDGSGPEGAPRAVTNLGSQRRLPRSSLRAGRWGAKWSGGGGGGSRRSGGSRELRLGSQARSLGGSAAAARGARGRGRTKEGGWAPGSARSPAAQEGPAPPAQPAARARSARRLGAPGQVTRGPGGGRGGACPLPARPPAPPGPRGPRGAGLPRAPGGRLRAPVPRSARLDPDREWGAARGDEAGGRAGGERVVTCSVAGFAGEARAGLPRYARLPPPYPPPPQCEHGDAAPDL